jgi:predicted enzyme involved in methoxymalonyl-ACP biosynthesis
MIASGAVALWLRLKDRFGDHGLVGVAIAKPDGGDWLIDTFLLSCRVIGRGAETALLAQLTACVRARGGDGGSLVGEYILSARNGLVGDFYPRHGFMPCGENRWAKRLSHTTDAPSYMATLFHE